MERLSLPTQYAIVPMLVDLEKEVADLVKLARCVLKDDANPASGKDTMQARGIANPV